MKTIVVANATPIVSLCMIGHEEILRRLFQRITIAKAVAEELRVGNKPGASFSDYDWVDVVSVENVNLVRSLLKDLDLGESETIALAIQMQASVVLIDELAGYQIAKNFNLQVFRTLSLLRTAKHRKIITEVRPLAEGMLKKGRWYSQTLIDKFLRDIGE